MDGAQLTELAEGCYVLGDDEAGLLVGVPWTSQQWEKRRRSVAASTYVLLEGLRRRGKATPSAEQLVQDISGLHPEAPRRELFAGIRRGLARLQRQNARRRDAVLQEIADLERWHSA
jgi:hypothetical protein